MLQQRGGQARARPRDPCVSLAAAQAQSLGVSFRRKIAPDDTLGPGCDWTHFPEEPVQAYTVHFNTRGGVELAFGQPNLHVVTVAGFGAVETPALFSLGERDCIVNVDVAPGQAVQVSYFYTGSAMPVTHVIACAKARSAAEMAMQNILALAK